MPAKERVPAATQPYYDPIVAITDAVCREHLNYDRYLKGQVNP